jgi:RHS repeat-associated protein
VTTLANVPYPLALAQGCDGCGSSFYVSSFTSYQVSRVDQLGNMTVIAGTGAECPSYTACGDGGPAVAAQLHGVTGLSVGPDGSVYLADGLVVRRITLDGMINTVAGNGTCSGGPGANTGTAALANGVGLLQGILAAPDGNVYISSTFCGGSGGFIERITPAGQLVPIAGTSANPITSDGAPATASGLIAPGAMAMSADGVLVFVDYGRVRQIGSDGILTTIAGACGSTTCPPNVPQAACTFGYCGDGVPATSSNLGVVNGLAFAPDRSLLLTSNLGRVLRVASPFPNFGISTYEIPNADASEVYVFDTTGRHLQTVDGLTGAPKYDFTYEVDPATGLAGRLTQVAYVPGTSHVTTIAYDDVAATRTITSPFGDVSTLTLDTFGNLATMSRPGGPASAPRTETYTFGFTPYGLLTSFSDPNGTANGTPHTMAYDSSGVTSTGRLTSDADPAGGLKSLSMSLTNTSNGPDYTVTKSTAGDQNQSYATTYRIAYDASGNEIRTNTSPTASTPAVTTIGTNGSTSNTLPDGTVVTTTLTPDPRYGLLSPTTTTSTTLPIGGLSRVEAIARFYDAQQRLNETDTVNGNTWTKIFDPVASTVTSTTPAGRTSVVQLDASGRTSSQTVAGFGTTSFAYTSAFGQLASTTRSASGVANRVSQNSYYAPGAGLGAAGNPSSAVDPLGNATTFDVYDLAGRILHQTLPGARPVGFAFDANGNQTEVDPPPATPSYGSTQALRAQHVFGFTSIDQLATYQVHDAAAAANVFLETTSYAYTPDRLLKTLVRPEGDVVSYATALGRVASFTAPLGESTQNTYDPVSGRLLGISGPMGVSLGFGYNGSLVTDVTWTGLAAGMTLHRDYDSNFRIIDETAEGSALFYGYDADGLLQCLGTAQSSNCAGQLGITRTAGTTVLASTAFPVAGPTQVTEGYTANGFGETLHYHALAGTQNVYQVDYTRDSLGRIATKSETLVNVDGSTTANSFTYTYDAAGRLTDVLAGDGTHTHYDHDLNGNRLRRTVEGPSENVEELGTYAVGDKLVSYNGTTYTWTASGQLQSATSAAGTATYGYDAFGNLTSVVLPNGTSIGYVIDGQNRRVGKTVSGKLVAAWLYADQLRIAAEIDFDGTTGNVTGVKRFGYGSKANVPDLMLMQDGTRYRILSDHLGSPRVVVAEAGAVIVARMDYDEFGRVLVNTQPGSLPFGFGGSQYDSDVALGRFGSRDYDAGTGRWMSKDPIRFDGGDTLLYGYNHGDPINQIDPTGLVTCNQCITQAHNQWVICTATAYTVFAAVCILTEGGATLPSAGVLTAALAGCQAQQANALVNCQTNSCGP